MMRSPLETSGFGPFIQQRRMPFFSSIVVMVAGGHLAQNVEQRVAHRLPR